MEKIDELKVQAFDLTKELGEIQETYKRKADQLEEILEEIKQCQK